jgi:hypothetical protein
VASSGQSAADATVPPADQVRQAAAIWVAFLIVISAINAGPLLLVGVDLHAWTESEAKSVLINVLVYGVFCLAVPLVVTQGWDRIRRVDISVAVLIAIMGIALNHVLPGAAGLVLAVVVYLHRRLDRAWTCPDSGSVHAGGGRISSPS